MRNTINVGFTCLQGGYIGDLCADNVGCSVEGVILWGRLVEIVLLARLWEGHQD
ncbi:hypothetical protein DPMN_048970 [Dreissena polymorpha]|uniref:Uncharacterized protein n=1 Tax=Dreissena polymorpha TaxID=45954 RepID=A0A9D4DEC9_DREPO|nr:hypothetical protein DPMN_048970 [Dreissena polymorpha]